MIKLLILYCADDRSVVSCIQFIILAGIKLGDVPAFNLRPRQLCEFFGEAHCLEVCHGLVPFLMFTGARPVLFLGHDVDDTG